MATDSIALPSAAAVSRPFVDRLHEWVTTVDHKRLGILYIGYGLVFLVIGGIEATVMRVQLMRSAQRLRVAPGLQPHVHDAWHHDDLLRGDAHRVRVRQLPGATDDRRARHGVPATERVQFLDDRVRRTASVLQLGGSATACMGRATRLMWDGSRTRR